MLIFLCINILFMKNGTVKFSQMYIYLIFDTILLSNFEKWEIEITKVDLQPEEDPQTSEQQTWKGIREQMRCSDRSIGSVTSFLLKIKYDDWPTNQPTIKNRDGRKDSWGSYNTFFSVNINVNQEQIYSKYI